MVIVALVTAAVVVVLAVLRVTGIDGNRYTASALATTPYVVVVGALLGGVTGALGQWWIGGLVLLSTGVLAAGVLPRLIPSARPDAAGRTVRVMASNLYLGRAEAKVVVQLVRTHRVDVLALLELTPEAAAELARAGLFDLLPYRLLQPSAGGDGSGVVSRYPVAELALAGPSRHAQPSVLVDLAGVALEVVAVHPVPPTVSAADWKAELAGLPAPVPGGPLRVLAGDFNATADHAAFRRLLRAGYLDAAQQRGAGLIPTWPSRAAPPPVTLDHILVDARCTVSAYRVVDVPGSDHRAVYAELTVPHTSQ